MSAARHYWVIAFKLRDGKEAYFAGLTPWRHAVDGLGEPPKMVGVGALVDWTAIHSHAVCFERAEDAAAVLKAMPDGARVIECGDGYWQTSEVSA